MANHLKSSLYTHTVYQSGKSSVRDLQDPSAHHSSVVFRNDNSVAHHSDDSVGPFRNDSSVCRSQRGSQSGLTAETKLKTSWKQLLKLPEDPKNTRFRSHEKLRTNRFFALLSNADSGLLETVVPLNQTSGNATVKILQLNPTFLLNGNSRHQRTLHFNYTTSNDVVPTNRNDAAAENRSLSKRPTAETLNNSNNDVSGFPLTKLLAHALTLTAASRYTLTAELTSVGI
ncbi:hypothetical protein F511_20095 [Dorcoceras hygrometricum]|uniref:Uncharacterized protein n=1 Tax=Dorcoceras hygrometricum TaxID=472368 RepID=A0A2Z7BC08_9LAMI|nr:hypothetical protein F511_20095 [Dorcoceras hygrometricum]